MSFQVLEGQSGHIVSGKELPCLVYMSREKRPGFDHRKKAGAVNALVSSWIYIQFQTYAFIDQFFWRRSTLNP